MRSSAELTGYHRLVVRLNRFPQGAPPSKLLYEILALLFSPKEADLVSRLPVRVFTVQKAARAWKMGLAETRRILDQLCRKALLVDIEQNGRMTYCLPPPMAGFFEFSLMHHRSDLDQKTLAEHLYRYINWDASLSMNLKSPPTINWKLWTTKELPKLSPRPGPSVSAGVIVATR
jgi:hypothetical protein